MFTRSGIDRLPRALSLFIVRCFRVDSGLFHPHPLYLYVIWDWVEWNYFSYIWNPFKVTEMSTTIIMLTSFSYLICPLLCHILAYLLWNEWQFGQFGLHTWWWRVVFNPKLWRLIQQWVESVNSGNKHLRLLVYTTQYMLPEKQLKIFLNILTLD